MKKAIRINGRVIPRGGREVFGMEIESGARAGALSLPVCVFRGEEDGPVLLVTAGLHGDELNGIEALRRMISDGSIEPDAGAVIALPIANVWGFLNSSRFLPDGKDLNRGFPGSVPGSLSQNIAGAIMRRVLPLADCGLDLHSGGESENYPHIRCDTSHPGNMELARAFSPPFILNSPLRDGTFRKAAWQSGKNVLVYEGGESRRLSEFAVSECVNGILRIMDHLRMTGSGAPERNETRVIEKSAWVRAKHRGAYSPRLSCGARVSRGDILADITGADGAGPSGIAAKASGYALSVRPAQDICKDDFLIHLGTHA